MYQTAKNFGNNRKIHEIYNPFAPINLSRYQIDFPFPLNKAQNEVLAVHEFSMKCELKHIAVFRLVL